MHYLFQAVAESLDVSPDLLEEVEQTLEILKRLGKPPIPVVQGIVNQSVNQSSSKQSINQLILQSYHSINFTVSGCDVIDVSWETMTTKSGFQVMYQLFEGHSRSKLCN